MYALLYLAKKRLFQLRGLTQERVDNVHAIVNFTFPPTAVNVMHPVQ